MFAFLGVAYSTSIRLSAIQGFSPLKTSLAFLCFNGMALIQLPLTIWLLRRFTARWPLTAGLVLMAAGALWMASVPASDLSLAPVIPACLLVGIGFGLALSALSMVAGKHATDSPGRHGERYHQHAPRLRFYPGTRSDWCRRAESGGGPDPAAASWQRNAAAGLVHVRFLAGHVPAAQRSAVEAAVHAVQSGPLGANAVPASITQPGGGVVPFNPLKPIAFDALGHSYALGFVLSGVAALLAAALTMIGMRARTDDTLLDLELLDD